VPATTGLYVFAYSLFFFVTKTKFVGAHQTVSYLMHMGELSLFIVANAFVHKIFADVKLD
jgi:hypothetical protein